MTSESYQFDSYPYINHMNIGVYHLHVPTTDSLRVVQVVEELEGL